MNQNDFDFVLAGNYLTTLVAAVGLARAGRKVCVVNPLPGWGGHFTRVKIGDLLFDAGAISHEFTAFNSNGQRDPLMYDPKRRNDWGRFANLIEDFTRGEIDLVRMRVPQTVYRGTLYPDIIMANRLDVARNEIIAERVKAEVAHALAKPDRKLHPRDKKDSSLYLEKSYYDVSLENHGATLHSALFEPQFFKMSNLSTTRLIALYHRIAWLPTYYPETLLSQYDETPQVLADTYFCYPKAGYIGHFGEVLVQRMEQSGVTIVREPVERLESKGGRSTVTLKDGRRLEAPRIIWSLAHDHLYSQVTGKAHNTFERWSATLVFATARREHLLKPFSVLYCPDDDVLFYRACNQTDSADLDDDVARIVVEINPDYAVGRGFTTDAQVVERVKADLCRLGILADPQHLDVAATRVMRNVLLLPSHGNWKLLETERDALLEAYPDVIFTRNVDAFFTDTLNDQIIKGLRLVEQLKNA